MINCLTVIICFRYITVSKNLSTKYLQENKERLQKKLVKDIKLFLKRKKKRSNVNDTKSLQKWKKKQTGWV